MNKIISRQIFFWIIILFFTSCELKINEDKDFATPIYRTDRIDSVTVKKYIIKGFFVKNYRYHKNKFDSVALDMVCQAINDSIPITNLDFTFSAGTNEILSNFICEYLWAIETPDKIRVKLGEALNQRDVIIPFDCKLNENYSKKIDFKRNE